jgi:hypothetical protein
MCDPGTIVAGASLAIGIGGKIAEGAAQNKAAAANKKASLAAMTEDWKALSLQEAQQQDAAQQSIMQADRQGRQADALARVSAGESGVAGASVDALLGDLSSQVSAFKVTTERNLSNTEAQLQQEKAGARVGAQSRINAVQPANPFATALAIGGMGLDFASNIIRAQPPSAGKTKAINPNQIPLIINAGP